MHRLLDHPGFWALMVLALVCGAVLLGAAAWTRPLAEAEQAIAARRLWPAPAPRSAIRERYLVAGEGAV
jgi:hypothetical protein